ncbi:MAG: hypothetical protein ACOC5K_02640, partial [Chloroflexota bacterium]
MRNRGARATTEDDYFGQVVNPASNSLLGGLKSNGVGEDEDDGAALQNGTPPVKESELTLWEASRDVTELDDQEDLTLTPDDSELSGDSVRMY